MSASTGFIPSAGCVTAALRLPSQKGQTTSSFGMTMTTIPPARISSGIAALEANPTADIAGSSKMFILLTRENVMLEVGPFGATHATAATYTIRRRYAEAHRFVETKVRGEELEFTQEWSANLIQVPAEETIVVLGHGRNTVDKSVILTSPDLFKAKVVNRDNGRMVLHARWPVPWDMFRTTFYT